jgi:hypothetical protein
MGALHAQNIWIDTAQGVLFKRNDLTQRSSYYPKLWGGHMDLTFRPLKTHERELLEKLLEPEFPGRDELRRQLDRNRQTSLRGWYPCAAMRSVSACDC